MGARGRLVAYAGKAAWPGGNREQCKATEGEKAELSLNLRASIYPHPAFENSSDHLRRAMASSAAAGRVLGAAVLPQHNQSNEALEISPRGENIGMSQSFYRNRPDAPNVCSACGQTPEYGQAGRNTTGLSRVDWQLFSGFHSLARQETHHANASGLGVVEQSDSVSNRSDGIYPSAWAESFAQRANSITFGRITLEESLSTATTDLDNALQLIARQAQSFTLADGAAIALKWPEKAPDHTHPSRDMTCRASAGDDAPGVGVRLQVGSGFSGECVREGKLLRCDDSEVDTRVDRDSCRTLGIRSMVAVPVKDRESVVGIIEIFSTLPKAFTDVDVIELQNLAGLVATAVEAAQHDASTTDNPHDLENSGDVLGSDDATGLPPAPVPKLLLELEPAGHVFFRNLTDTLLRREAPVVYGVSRPELLWNDIFVDSAMPWKRFLQSVLWHLVALIAVWNLSQGWATSEQILRRRTISHNSYVSYYQPPSSFPTAGSHRPVARAVSRAGSRSAPRPALLVRTGSSQPAIAPPTVKLTPRGRLSLVAWKPGLPLAPRPAALAVTPPRRTTFSSAGRPSLVQASVVAPPPLVGAVFGQPAVARLRPLVVVPSPTLEFSISPTGNATFGRTAVVGPPPAMPSREQSNMAAVSLAGAGAVIGPPPGMPSREQSSMAAITLAGAGAVVGPPPGMPLHEHSSISAVTLAGAGTVIGPPPGMPLHEQPGIAAGTLGASGASVVPPPPSLAGSATLDRRNAGSLSGAGSQVAIPSPSVTGADAPAGGSRQVAMNIHPPVAPLPPPRIEEPRGGSTQELPVRLIGLSLALPGSSFFSNYEVFIAERRIAKDESQLIKLVYESRPYQRRMSEYGLDNSKIYKLRVTRDATCDETASQVAGNHYSELQSSAGHRAFPDRNTILPCYRTTVDDYRKTLSRGR